MSDHTPPRHREGSHASSLVTERRRCTGLNQPKQLGDPRAGVGGGRDHQPVAGAHRPRAGRQDRARSGRGGARSGRCCAVASAPEAVFARAAVRAQLPQQRGDVIDVALAYAEG